MVCRMLELIQQEPCPNQWLSPVHHPADIGFQNCKGQGGRTHIHKIFCDMQEIDCYIKRHAWSYIGKISMGESGFSPEKTCWCMDQLPHQQVVSHKTYAGASLSLPYKVLFPMKLVKMASFKIFFSCIRPVNADIKIQSLFDDELFKKK